MKGRLLLAENNDDYRNWLHRYLADAGFDVIDAPTVDDAQRRLMDSSGYHVVLADLRMTPEEREDDKTGYSIVRQAYEKHIPAIVITNYTGGKITREALKPAGDVHAADFFFKGDGPDALVDEVNQLRGATLLHISDLHLHSIEAYRNPPDQDEAIRTITRDIYDREVISFHPLKAIVVSGDVAWRCNRDTFARAREFLLALARALGVPKEGIILTPGNHDVDWLKGFSGENTLMRRKRGATWIGKFRSYLGFSKAFYGKQAFTSRNPYRVFYPTDHIAIASFISSWFEGDEKAKCPKHRDPEQTHYYGWIDPEDIRLAAEEISRTQPRGYHIAVWHHNVPPESCLPEDPDCIQRYVKNYYGADGIQQALRKGGFRLALYGHRHKEEARQPTIPQKGGPYRFGAGTIWTTETETSDRAHYSLFVFARWGWESRVIMRRYMPFSTEEDRQGYWMADTYFDNGTRHCDGGSYLADDVLIP